VAAAAALGPALRAGTARAAGGLGATEGVVVNVFLGGGNDGLNTVVPMAGAVRARYDQLRGGVAVPAGQLFGVSPEWGLHPGLGALKGWFDAGHVAIVQGAGLAGSDLSHLTATRETMAGTTEGNGTGWLGRYLDELPDSAEGLRAVAISSSVPMFLQGRRANVTTLAPGVPLWGVDRSAPGEAALVDAVAAFADGPSGLGPLGDLVAATGKKAIEQAHLFTNVVAQAGGTAGAMASRLGLAAQVVNADLGVRTIGVVLGGGFDTHFAQTATHGQLLSELDGAINHFFASLAPAFHDRVVMVVQSEFGRRPMSNASAGTDHGTVNPVLVIGRNVRGGLHGAPPSLDALDDRGNLVPTVDYRAVYEQVLGRW
ncbi:MAG TPA: DUF1501 domain-containing protein, partial [Acidimicrobiales bacterium]|nr:DUF1501 domain-containing protein [Acidimicrobiales bacterium]